MIRIWISTDKLVGTVTCGTCRERMHVGAEVVRIVMPTNRVAYFHPACADDPGVVID